MSVKGHAFVRNCLPKGLQAVDSAVLILLETTSNPFVCQRLKAKETFAAKKSAPLSTAAYGTTNALGGSLGGAQSPKRTDVQA